MNDDLHLLSSQQDRRRRRIYQAATLACLPSILMVWSQHREANSFINYTYPVLIIGALGWSVALGWPRVRVAHIERLVLLVVATFILGKYLFLLWSAAELRYVWAEIEAVFWVIPFLFIIGYLVMHRQIALLLSVVYATLMLAIGWIRLMEVEPGLLLDLVRLHARIAGIALLLFILAKAKDDLYETQRAAFEMQWAANTDTLTQLPNRRRLTVLLDQLLAEQRHFAVLIVDVDHFKRINDTLGHAAGDLVLTEVGERLRQHLRADDIVGRWGGEEFLILVHEHDQKLAAHLAERLRQAIAAHPFNRDLQVTASIGATMRRMDDSSHTLLHRADMALYQAKANGRNRVEWS